jgi:hypothetical protein
MHYVVGFYILSVSKIYTQIIVKEVNTCPAPRNVAPLAGLDVIVRLVKHAAL